eukprot:12867083-Prorocentrum_lima.AAC.1
MDTTQHSPRVGANMRWQCCITSCCLLVRASSTTFVPTPTRAVKVVCPVRTCCLSAFADFRSGFRIRGVVAQQGSEQRGGWGCDTVSGTGDRGGAGKKRRGKG